MVITFASHAKGPRFESEREQERFMEGFPFFFLLAFPPRPRVDEGGVAGGRGGGGAGGGGAGAAAGGGVRGAGVPHDLRSDRAQLQTIGPPSLGI